MRFTTRNTISGWLAKIHKHDDKPARGYGLIWQGRLVCFYSYECDLGDGWEDKEVHKDPEEVRAKAFKMGANLLQYVSEPKVVNSTKYWKLYC